MKILVKIAVSEHARRNHLLEHHVLLPSSKTIELKWKNVSPKTRIRLLNLCDSIDQIEMVDLSQVENNQQRYPFFAERYPHSIKDWENLLEAYASHRQTFSPEQRELEKNQWIATHGSLFLRRLREQHYKAEKLYATERAALEHPGFTLVQQLEAQELDTPSPTAFELALNHGGRVIWVQQPPPNSQAGLFPIECEAVLIESYLEHHRLVFWVHLHKDENQMRFFTRQPNQ